MPDTGRLSFTSAGTLQLRLILGTPDHPTQMRGLPEDLDIAPNEEWITRDGLFRGRAGGLDGDIFMPTGTLAPSNLSDDFLAGGDAGSLGYWSVEVNGVPVAVDSLSRKTNIHDSVRTGPFDFAFQTLENVFLDLSGTLRVGDVVTVTLSGGDGRSFSATYDPASVVSEAIHVNLVGYDPDDARKVAYLSSWNGVDAAGNPVQQTYAAGTSYSVIDEATGRVVLSGALTDLTPTSQTTNFTLNFAGTDVWELDISALDAVGDYHIVVDGVGRSEGFSVDDLTYTDLFDTAFSGFYHQRSGIALTDDFTDWTRPRSLHPDDGFVVRQSTLRITQTSEGYDHAQPEPFAQFAGTETGEILDDAWGGWHDAGDFDRRTQHLEASRKLIELMELQPDFAERAHASIPEAGDAVPDLLDEALWNLDFFRRLQKDDGGVGGGIESDDYPTYGEGSWADSHALYAYAPDVWSTWEYAASAAKAARALAPYDSGAAQEWTRSALDAMAWAEARVPFGDAYDATLQTSRNLAAIELHALTGEARWADLYEATTVYDGRANIQWFEQQWEAAFVAARLGSSDIRADYVAHGEERLVGQADFLLADGQDSGFGYTIDPYAPYGWGNTATHPNYAADFLLRAHALTNGVRYLEQAQADIQYALGANPLNMAYLTGLDVRSPLAVLNTDAEALGRDAPPGLVIFGDYNVADYGRDAYYHDIMANTVYPDYDLIPVAESFNDFFFFVPSTEYTVQQGISDMTFVLGYLAGHQDFVTNSQELYGTNDADDYRGGLGDDVISGFGGDDRLVGSGGDDIIMGGEGDDVIYGDGA